MSEKKKDYIKECKSDTGYRGIHLIRKYKGKMQQYHDLSIEIQLRTKIQHAWATAVEIIGTFTKQDLKSGKGDSKWLEYFKIISFLFAHVEGYSYETQEFTIAEIEKHKELGKKLTQELRGVENLLSFSLMVEAVEENKIKDGYFVLSLDVNKKILQGFGFKKKELLKATNFYAKKEKEKKGSDTVLVATKSINELKKGYPNYFADSNLFRETLSQVLS